jgi:hypothetical protein
MAYKNDTTRDIVNALERVYFEIDDQSKKDIWEFALKGLELAPETEIKLLIRDLELDEEVDPEEIDLIDVEAVKKVFTEYGFD